MYDADVFDGDHYLADLDDGREGIEVVALTFDVDGTRFYDAKTLEWVIPENIHQKTTCLDCEYYGRCSFAAESLKVGWCKWLHAPSPKTKVTTP